MRRRSFIATLPLAAAGPALARDQQSQHGVRPAGGDPWTEIQGAPVTPIGSVGSRNIIVTGQATITGFGEAPDGVTRTVRFAQEMVLVHGPGRLDLPNNGQDLLIGPGDVITAISRGGGAWVIVAYQPSGVFAKIDRRRSDGGGHYKFAIGADAGTAFPDFAVDGAYGRVKTAAKSIILGDPQDTTEIGAIAANGTPAAPGVWNGRAPHHITYSYAPHVDLDLKGAPSVATYNGRFAQEYFFQLETPGPNTRGGGIAWGATMPGQIVPYDRMWLRNYGLVLPGRAAFEDSGLDYGHDYGAGPGGARANYHHIFAPGPVNWGDVAGWGNLSLVASDEATGCSAIAIRRNGALGTGHDWMYNLQADELRLHTVSNGARTARWGVPVEGGHLLPVTARTVDIGSPARPLRTLHADSLDVRRATRGPAAEFHALRPDHEGDVLTLNAGRAASPDFHFLRASSTVDGIEEPAALIDGAGSAFIAGGLAGDGRGSGAYMEWADGNPEADDRVGWTVALEGRQIRRARQDDPPSAIIGVITARPNVVGDAAWRHWSKKHLTDDFGRPLTRPVEHVRWTERLTQTQQAERLSVVRETIRRPRLERVEGVERTPRIEEVDGRWIERMVEVRRVVERPAVRHVAVHGEDGLPVLDAQGRLRMEDVPDHEEAEIERTVTYAEPVDVDVGCIEHCYPSHAVPAGVTVPAHAERLVMEQKVSNPDYDPALPYAPRRDRREWDVVSFCGPEFVRTGEAVGDRWARMRQVSGRVEEWLVR